MRSRMIAVILVGILSGCSQESPKIDSIDAREVTGEIRSLENILKTNELRILIHGSPHDYLPRSGYPLGRERKLADKFALSLGVHPVYVVVDNFQDLIPSLLEGKGDLIAANLTVLESRMDQVAFSRALDTSWEVIVSGANQPKVDQLNDLSNHTIAVQEGTSFMETAKYIQSKFPRVTIKSLPGDLTQDQILDLIAAGSEDLTIEDSNTLKVALGYRDDINPGVKVTREGETAWAVRTDSPQLLKAINSFLDHELSPAPRGESYLGDLPEIKKKKTIRMLTLNNAASYFMLKGDLMGFEYELAGHLAQDLGVELEVIVAPAFKDLIPWLLKGKGDFIAANVTPSLKREAKGISFSKPYDYVSEELVAPRGSGLKSIKDLGDKKIVVRKESSYWESLEKIRQTGINLQIEEAPDHLQTEEIIEQVASGTYPLTVADSNILAIETAWGTPVIGAFSLSSEKIPHCWAVRKNDTKLLKAINDFIDRTYKSTFYNLTYKKYFANPRNIRELRKQEGEIKGKISNYDAWFKKYAGIYGFEWLLIAAQAYQESRFKPQAVSWAGAKGLMQVMPKTAQQMKLSPLDDPEIGLHAGVKYLDWTRERFRQTIPNQERLWFALAAYNAGAGHVQDARRLAKKLGWDDNVWFDQTEKAMLLLAKPQYAQQARYGYVRGKEPVDYVRRIRRRYLAYRDLF